ncbi:hypothetical protein SRHO_G00191930 [Serrasalmus rhombeus]
MLDSSDVQFKLEDRLITLIRIKSKVWLKQRPFSTALISFSVGHCLCSGTRRITGHRCTAAGVDGSLTHRQSGGCIWLL